MKTRVYESDGIVVWGGEGENGFLPNPADLANHLRRCRGLPMRYFAGEERRDFAADVALGRAIMAAVREGRPLP